tara:strand:- start:210 stop:446 length:237 start_codon:yes stop_codon:yes gene_type:complete
MVVTNVHPVNCLRVIGRVRSGKMAVKKKASKKPKPTDPAKWSRAKAKAKGKFKVYPSAYANAWAAKEYKKMGGSWRNA